MKKIKKIICVVGTRPEAIKMAPLMLALKNDARYSPLLLSTGQHTSMLISALEPFGLKADIDLQIMRQNQTLDYVTSAVIEGAGRIFDSQQPDMVLVHGDTTTTMASAMAAFYRHIPVGHVEAGLRSFNLERPFPEELNRIVTDTVSSLWFAPTEGARDNLLKEPVINCKKSNIKKIYVTGNTVIDALLWIKDNVKEPAHSELAALRGEKFILVTAHRRESWGEGMERIALAVKKILGEKPDLKAVIPMHSNPKVREIIKKYLGDEKRAILCEPLNYPDFVWAMTNSTIILSDSGGVQEEASAIKKPVLILRDVTERPEAIEQGSCILVGTSKEKIYETAIELLEDDKKYEELINKCAAPFGDGTASLKICEAIDSYFA